MVWGKCVGDGYVFEVDVWGVVGNVEVGVVGVIVFEYVVDVVGDWIDFVLVVWFDCGWVVFVLGM